MSLKVNDFYTNEIEVAKNSHNSVYKQMVIGLLQTF